MTFDKVKEVIVDSLGCDEEAVVLTANLKEDLNADSLDAVELSMALEEAFGFTIADEDLMAFVTVKDIVDYIDKNLA
ncbi:MAG: acyl carrier protein [Lachnospiraceae bacterium]|nr:acyl carrier protein [Lachnospiraceae bacterium]